MTEPVSGLKQEAAVDRRREGMGGQPGRSPGGPGSVAAVRCTGPEPLGEQRRRQERRPDRPRRRPRRLSQRIAQAIARHEPACTSQPLDAPRCADERGRRWRKVQRHQRGQCGRQPLHAARVRIGAATYSAPKPRPPPRAGPQQRAGACSAHGPRVAPPDGRRAGGRPRTPREAWQTSAAPGRDHHAAPALGQRRVSLNPPSAASRRRQRSTGRQPTDFRPRTPRDKECGGPLHGRAGCRDALPPRRARPWRGGARRAARLTPEAPPSRRL